MASMLRHAGRFQRRAAAQRFLRLVGTAVGNDDGVFHIFKLLQSRIPHRARCRGRTLASRSICVDGRLRGPFGGRVGHDHQRHDASFGSVRLVLDDRGDRDAVAAQHAGDLGHHAGPIVDVEPQVEPAGHVGRIARTRRGFRAATTAPACGT